MKASIKASGKQKLMASSLMKMTDEEILAKVEEAQTLKDMRKLVVLLFRMVLAIRHNIKSNKRG